MPAIYGVKRVFKTETVGKGYPVLWEVAGNKIAAERRATKIKVDTRFDAKAYPVTKKEFGQTLNGGRVGFQGTAVA